MRTPCGVPRIQGAIDELKKIEPAAKQSTSILIAQLVSLADELQAVREQAAELGDMIKEAPEIVELIKLQTAIYKDVAGEIDRRIPVPQLRETR